MKIFSRMVWTFLLASVPATSYSQYKSSAPAYVPAPYVAPAPRPAAPANSDSISRASGALKRGGGIDGAMAELMSGDGTGTSAVSKRSQQPTFTDQAMTMSQQNLSADQTSFEKRQALSNARLQANAAKEKEASRKEEQAIIDRTKGNEVLPDVREKEAERKRMNAKYDTDMAAQRERNIAPLPVTTAEEQAIIDRTKGNEVLPDVREKEAERKRMNAKYDTDMAAQREREHAERVKKLNQILAPALEN